MIQVENSHQCRKLLFSVNLLGMQSIFKSLVCKSHLANENLMTSLVVYSSFFSPLPRPPPSPLLAPPSF